MTVMGIFRSGKSGRMTIIPLNADGTYQVTNNWINIKARKIQVGDSGVDEDTTNFECFVLALPAVVNQAPTALTGLGSSGSGGGRSFSQGLLGIETATITVNGHFDFSQQKGQGPGGAAYKGLMDNPPGLYPRDDGPAMRAYGNRQRPAGILGIALPGQFYEFMSTRILSATMDIDVNGVVGLDLSAKSQGPYRRPTGSVTV